MRPARLASGVSAVLGFVGACGGHTDTLGTATSGAAAGSTPAGSAGAGTGGAHAAGGEMGGAVGGVAGAGGVATSGAGGAGGGATSGAGGIPGASGGSADTAGAAGFVGGDGGGGAGAGGDDGLQPGSPWPMSHHDPRHTGASAHKGPSMGHIKWNRQAGVGVGGATQAGAPVVATDGTVYSMFNAVLHALDADGKDKCVFQTKGALLDTGSSPAIGRDSTVYFGTQSKDGTGDFYAVTPGCVGKWSIPLAGGVSIAPVIGGDGTIYASASNALHALSPGGSVKWTLNTPLILGTPAIGLDGTIFLPVAGGVDAVRADGTLQWQSPTSTAASSVSVAEGGVVYGGGDKLYALSPDDGTPLWGYGVPDELPRDCPAVGGDGTIYVPFGSKGLHALTPDGSLKWKADVPAYGSPVVDGDGNVYVGGASVTQNGTARWMLGMIGGQNAALAGGGVAILADMPGAQIYAVSTGP